jgi:hypothetical protein
VSGELSLLIIFDIEGASTRPGTPQVGCGVCRAVRKLINELMASQRDSEESLRQVVKRKGGLEGRLPSTRLEPRGRMNAKATEEESVDTCRGMIVMLLDMEVASTRSETAAAFYITRWILRSFSWDDE